MNVNERDDVCAHVCVCVCMRCVHAVDRMLGRAESKWQVKSVRVTHGGYEHRISVLINIYECIYIRNINYELI